MIDCQTSVAVIGITKERYYSATIVIGDHAADVFKIPFANGEYAVSDDVIADNRSRQCCA